MAILERLKAIKIGKSAKIAGKVIYRVGEDEFKLDDDYMTANKLTEVLAETPLADMSYKRIGFILKTTDGATVGSYKCADKHQYHSLLSHAKLKKLRIWCGDIKVLDGREAIIGPLWVDWASFSDDKEDKPSGNKVLRCQKCGIEFKSQSGYTLHMKAKH